MPKYKLLWASQGAYNIQATLVERETAGIPSTMTHFE
jgi:hypothetical protein